ncbi:MAG TPA: Rab family GTPase [Coleofasciculaceae cyanobacterium]
MQTLSKKICLVGDYAVGKTSLIRRFVDRQFSDRYLSTIGVKISRKSVPLPSDERYGDPRDPTTVQLLNWDVEGQTKFQRIASSYVQGASGAIIVADATRLETISHLCDHAALMRSVSPGSVTILAINKTDLLDDAELQALRAKTDQLLTGYPFSVYWTSAKNGTCVDDIFLELSSAMVQPASRRPF